MSCSISSKHIKATRHILLRFSITDTRYHQTSNIQIMQTEIIKYIFYQVGVIALFSSFQHKNSFHLFPLFQHLALNESGRIYKINNLPSSSLVKDIF